VRLTYNAQGDVQETADYEPFGAVVAEAGEEARTGYIGRETDNESNLGFNGVRLYDQQYGRFLSTDAMWEKYRALQPYQYSNNRPIVISDANGNDYDVKFDGSKVTISATFYCDASSYGAAQSAAAMINSYNNEKMSYTDESGNTFAIAVDIKVELAADPLYTALMVNSGIDEATGEVVSSNGVHGANSIITVPDSKRPHNPDALAWTARSRIEVRSDFAKDVEVVAHEMGHAIGFEHRYGIMTKHPTDPQHSLAFFEDQFRISVKKSNPKGDPSGTPGVGGGKKSE